MEPMKLRVLVRQSMQPELWVAICLERYIVAQGNSAREAVRSLGKMLTVEIGRGIDRGNEIDPLAGIRPAPTEYWDMFALSQLPCRYQFPRKVPEKAGIQLPKIEKRIAESA